jgi:tetratricopeptide (TPR) repeat protein
MARSHQILADMVVRVPVHDENLVRFHLRSAIRIAERLAALDPWDKTAQSELAQYLSSGAEELLHPEDDKETLGYLRRAMPIFETLLKSEPANRDLQLYAALTEADMGEHLGRRKSSAESIAWLRRGIADLQALVEMNRNTTNVLELIKVQEWLSLSLAKAGRKAEALEVVEGAVANARFLADQGRGAPESRRELPRAYAAVGMIYDVLGQRSEARKSYRSATVEWEKMISQGLHFPDSEQEIEDARKGASTGGTAAVIH